MNRISSMSFQEFVDSFQRCLHQRVLQYSRASRETRCGTSLSLSSWRCSRSSSAPRDVSGDHVLYKRESPRVEEPLHVPLSYRMERGPGIKDGFTREKRSRVSLHLVVMQRRGGEEGQVCAGGKSGLREGSGWRRERVWGGEGNDGEKERLCSEGERDGSSYNAPLVHCPEEVRKRTRERDSGIEKEKRRIYCPLARSNLFRLISISLSLSFSLLYKFAPQVSPVPSSSLHSAKRYRERRRRERDSKKKRSGGKRG